MLQTVPEGAPGTEAPAVQPSRATFTASSLAPHALPPRGEACSPLGSPEAAMGARQLWRARWGAADTHTPTRALAPSPALLSPGSGGVGSSGAEGGQTSGSLAGPGQSVGRTQPRPPCLTGPRAGVSRARLVPVQVTKPAQP